MSGLALTSVVACKALAAAAASSPSIRFRVSTTCWVRDQSDFLT